MVTATALGAALRAWRQARRWSQPRLAAELGVAPRIVSRWERGIHRPRPAHLAALIRLGFVPPARPAATLPWRCAA